MFNRSRKIACSHCHGDNFWKGDPAPTDELACRYCNAFITTYDDYIHNFIRVEAARMLAQFMETDSEHDLAMLKHALSQQRPPRPQRVSKPYLPVIR
jgi:cytochrome c553